MLNHKVAAGGIDVPMVIKLITKIIKSYLQEVQLFDALTTDQSEKLSKLGLWFIYLGTMNPGSQLIMN